MPREPGIGLRGYRRVVELDSMMRRGMRFRLNELSDRFGVSMRTIQRDIDYMRVDLKAPIDYDARTHRFAYGRESFNLPVLSFSENELFALLLAERSLRQYVNIPFNGRRKKEEDFVHNTFNKIVALLPKKKGLSQWVKNACKAISFQNPYPVAKIDPRVFDQLMSAIAKSKRIRVDYRLIGPNEVHSLELDPYHLANWGGDWFLIAKSREFRMTKNYHVARISKVEKLNRYFLPPNEFDPNKHMAGVFGQMKEAKTTRVRVRVHPPASRWVKERNWQFVESLEEEKGGAVVLSMMVIPNRAVKSWVMQFGNEAELLEPAKLREEIREEMKAAAERY